MEDTKEIISLHRHTTIGAKMKKTHQFSAIIQIEDDWYVSTCPKLDVASQGKTMEEAISNLKEAVELFLEDKKQILLNLSNIHPPRSSLLLVSWSDAGTIYHQEKKT